MSKYGAGRCNCGTEQLYSGIHDQDNSRVTVLPVFVQWNLSWKTTTMRNHLSWQTMHFRQKVLDFNIYNWTCHRTPPVLTDHIFVADGVVFQDRFYGTTKGWHTSANFFSIKTTLVLTGVVLILQIPCMCKILRIRLWLRTVWILEFHCICKIFRSTTHKLKLNTVQSL